MIPDLKIEDYAYPLPDDKIAKYPLEKRDESKLLRFRDGKIDSFIFKEIPALLPENSIMVFNDTKVVPARLHFVKATGARIEIFFLEPVDPPEYNMAFAATSSCVWRCVIGNAKKWKDGSIGLYVPDSTSKAASLSLTATLLGREGETGLVRFSWDGGLTFSEVIDICGTVPIPPYLGRDTEAVDKERYQTLYARIQGSVAAPTAGLHFSREVLDRIRDRGIDIETVCLHVGAGTFLPVKESDVARHPMHREPFSVSADFIKDILSSHKKIVAVGTTSVRTLESLYYVGVSCIENGCPADVRQLAPYEREYTYSTEEALQAIVDYLERTGRRNLEVGTRIIIVPGFRFRLTDVLVTNFHQPESTLILLVSAFVGGEWRKIYDYALSHSFRFLSYGDSSLLFRVD